MQRVVIDEPYEFVPPVYSEWWPTLLRFYLRRYLRTAFGIHSVECRHVERLKASLAAGHSIMLAPNHCRMSDPVVLGVLGMEGRLPPVRDGELACVQAKPVSNLHDAADGRVQHSARRQRPAGDRNGDQHSRIAAAAADCVPEGAITRHNDLIDEMMDGPSFIARQAAKRLKKEGKPGGVVIHPVATRYAFHGDLATALGPDLDALEIDLSWQPQRHLSLVDRIGKIGQALLSLKEIEFLGAPRSGNIYERAEKLVEEVLRPSGSRLADQRYVRQSQ